MDNFPPVILEEMEGVLSILLLIGYDPLVHIGNSCITLYTCLAVCHDTALLSVNGEPSPISKEHYQGKKQIPKSNIMPPGSVQGETIRYFSRFC